MIGTIRRIRRNRNLCITICKQVHHVAFIFLFAYFSMCPASRQAGKGFVDHTVFNSRASITSAQFKDSKTPPHAPCAIQPSPRPICQIDLPADVETRSTAAVFPPDGRLDLLATTRLIV
jgi:hypothetical protein